MNSTHFSYFTADLCLSESHLTVGLFVINIHYLICYILTFTDSNFR